MLVSMAALAAGGWILAHGPVGEAIAWAAAAAAIIDVARALSQRAGSASDRELAAATVAGAAAAVLRVPVQFTESLTLGITLQVPELTMRGIGEGQRLFLKLHDPASEIDRVRRRLFDHRQLYAATVGTQVVLLDEGARRVAIDAQRELDAAIIALDQLRDTQWRHHILGRSGDEAKPLGAYAAADLEPASQRFHALAASAAALLGWLEHRRGRAPRRAELGPDQHTVRRVTAAHALVAETIDSILGDIGPLANYVKDSSLAAVQVRSLEDVAAVEELTFSGAAIGNGWQSLHSVAMQGEGRLREVLDMLDLDLPDSELQAARRLEKQLRDVGRAAWAANEGERAANDARVREDPDDQVRGAEDVFAARRDAYRDGLREALESARAILARRPSGF